MNECRENALRHLFFLSPRTTSTKSFHSEITRGCHSVPCWSGASVCRSGHWLMFAEDVHCIKSVRRLPWGGGAAWKLTRSRNDLRALAVILLNNVAFSATNAALRRDTRSARRLSTPMTVAYSALRKLVGLIGA